MVPEKTISTREYQLLSPNQVNKFISQIRCRGIRNRGLKDGSGELQVRQCKYKGNQTMVLHLLFLMLIVKERLV
jgi:hypothetical protein